MTINKVLALRLQQLCREKNITLHELARRSGVSLQTLQIIIHNKQPNRNFHISTIYKICAGLHISMYSFLNTPEFDALRKNL